MNDELDLSPAQLDALKEIGNIGAGNSATALSQVINRRIDMNVPKVALVPLEAVPDLVGGPDAIVGSTARRRATSCSCCLRTVPFIWWTPSWGVLREPPPSSISWMSLP